MRRNKNQIDFFPVALDSKIPAIKIRMNSAMYKSMKVVILEIKGELNFV
ncbi:MAG TPA: hypothetical protein VEI96_13670 [Thermodesulfovibrionales bacterium]|nr:hypothetical protein [Thermodesulfovibrionales bacterium]